jgi:two-component system sensor histidine kinase/response regulator
MADQQARLIIVDDEGTLLHALCELLHVEGYRTQGFTSARDALAAVRPGEFDLLLTDLQMPEMGGIDLINRAREIDPDLAAIVMTGCDTSDTAVPAMQGAAFDCIPKPVGREVVVAVLSKALTVQRLRKENAALQAAERMRILELATANQALELFSYSVSHDLRAPLRAVDSLVQILDEDFGERLGDEGRGILDVLRKGCGRLDQLITGLLAFSQAVRQPVDLVKVNMMDLAREAVDRMMVDYGGTAPLIDLGSLPSSMGDVTLLRQVWCQLIGNALKFSAKRPQRQLKIYGRIEGRETIYQVEDNGTGFDMKYAPKLFGVFQRLHKAEDFAGTGVGLAIAHRIVVRHGGRIWAEGTPDEGASFHFALPIRAIP